MDSGNVCDLKSSAHRTKCKPSAARLRGQEALPDVSVLSQRRTGSLSRLAAIKERQRGGVTATEGMEVIGELVWQDDHISLLVS